MPTLVVISSSSRQSKWDSLDYYVISLWSSSVNLFLQLPGHPPSLACCISDVTFYLIFSSIHDSLYFILFYFILFYFILFLRKSKQTNKQKTFFWPISKTLFVLPLWHFMCFSVWLLVIPGLPQQLPLVPSTGACAPKLSSIWTKFAWVEEFRAVHYCICTVPPISIPSTPDFM
jgi:hypothetical protein